MGCCNGRSNNEGNIAYSKEHAHIILNEIRTKGDLKVRYNAGWRTHHVIKEVRRNILTVQVEKEDIYFLTVVIENHPEALKEESILTVSEESLKGTGLHGHNYEYILSSAELREVLSNNYKDEYGVPIKDKEIIAFFNELHNKAGDDHNNVFVLLKKAFEIQDEKKVEVTATPNAFEGKENVVDEAIEATKDVLEGKKSVWEEVESEAIEVTKDEFGGKNTVVEGLILEAIEVTNDVVEGKKNVAEEVIIDSVEVLII